MEKELQIIVPPSIAFDDIQLNYYIKNLLKIDDNSTFFAHKLRRSIDARSTSIKVNLTLKVYINQEFKEDIFYTKPKIDVSKSPQAIIIGAGPAGLFAALKLIEIGIKPVILERGKNIKERRRDLAAINKEHIVNPESNYCFGEGGAGTYSDGKLYTRSHKRGDIQRILEILYVHGAPSDILVDAHPHIGTNKLPKLIENIRETLLNAGAEIHFNTKVTDFIVQNKEIKSVITNHNSYFEGLGVILATGHSARDIFYLLKAKDIDIEAKPFALGVRAEHQQSFIDKVQYHCEDRGQYLPASSYALVQQADFEGVSKGVFSFCMCPGGIIAPCATESGEIVVNGWSPSKRNNAFANSGIVVSVDESDWKKYNAFGSLAALEYQKEVEKKACILAGNSQKAPAQLLQDFVQNKVSGSLLPSSYTPGLSSVDLREVLPKPVFERLKIGFKAFNTKIKGYTTNDSQVVGVESRTSSPVRIPRNKENCEHISTKRLFPCGEGAGYAGGIVSAAMDGERCASHLAKIYFNKN